eukprot:1159061-Pelagomonas_calceolata.AAC.12
MGERRCRLSDHALVGLTDRVKGLLGLSLLHAEKENKTYVVTYPQFVHAVSMCLVLAAATDGEKRGLVKEQGLLLRCLAARHAKKILLRCALACVCVPARAVRSALYCSGTGAGGNACLHLLHHHALNDVALTLHCCLGISVTYVHRHRGAQRWRLSLCAYVLAQWSPLCDQCGLVEAKQCPCCLPHGPPYFLGEIISCSPGAKLFLLIRICTELCTNRLPGTYHEPRDPSNVGPSCRSTSASCTVMLTLNGRWTRLSGAMKGDDPKFVPQGSSVSSNPMQSLEHLSFPVAHMLFGAFGSERSLCTCA